MRDVQNYNGPERRLGGCDNHEDMIRAMTIIATNLKWHTRIGYAVFTVGCGIIGITLSALLYFGGMNKQVEINTANILAITKKIEKIEDAMNGYH